MRAQTSWRRIVRKLNGKMPFCGQENRFRKKYMSLEAHFLTGHRLANPPNGVTLLAAAEKLEFGSGFERARLSAEPQEPSFQ